MKRVLFSFIVLILSQTMSAQQVSVSANILGYATLGTMNADVSYSISRRWSITAGARYNPFTFRKGDAQKQFQLRQQSYSIGARLWPWHTLSGWWFASKLRYQEYNQGGILSRDTQEGDRAGVGLYSGYTHMLSRHLNIEFGVGVWTGADFFSRYSCPICGVCYQRGVKAFVLPDDIAVSLVYVF
jgi:hypothetical protein